MRFWDSSAIVPLLVDEEATRAVQAAAVQDPIMLVWWATEIECASALSRLERDGSLDEKSAQAAFERLKALATAWHEVDATDPVRETAVRFLRVHALRASDACQLAAAFVAAERRPSTLEIVALDDRLAAAARKEGFPVTILSAV